jgi:ferric-dicitrate binding protein FerR (iron transport regulator)
MSDPDLERWIAAWLDGRIDQADSDLLQQRLRESGEARHTFRKFSQLDAAVHEISAGELGSDRFRQPSEIRPDVSRDALALTRLRMMPLWAQLAFAASLLFLVGGVAFRLGADKTNSTTEKNAAEDYVATAEGEQTIEGFATLRRIAGIRWARDAQSYREGDVLPGGVLEFVEGVAEIDLFCGATLVVEGPAKLDLESDWSVRVLAGRLRASVPPAARGFVVKAAESEIIDLGTEFALEVARENIRVEVIDGEVALRGGRHDGDHLLTGEGQSLMGSKTEQHSLTDLSTVGDVRRLRETERRQRFAEWKAASQQLRKDKRLIAYYPIAESGAERSIRNVADSGRGLDGTLVGLVNHAPGRFGPESVGLEFDRPGSRVRARIDGEFNALTFACWVKIDSLEHRYNALFMGDGYENGEPHWQIREDGRMMFSVMVDDTPGAGNGALPDARLHHIYFTEPIWDVSKSGQWLHLAVTYDPAARRVSQYVNGNLINSEPINDRFYVQTLRIGPAEIGNWGQPLRESPWFAVRNLNGAIDELAIFNAALDSNEISALYKQGKPFGY